MGIVIKSAKRFESKRCTDQEDKNAAHVYKLLEKSLSRGLYGVFMTLMEVLRRTVPQGWRSVMPIRVEHHDKLTRIAIGTYLTQAPDALRGKVDGDTPGYVYINILVKAWGEDDAQVINSKAFQLIENMESFVGQWFKLVLESNPEVEMDGAAYSAHFNTLVALIELLRKEYWNVYWTPMRLDGMRCFFAVKDGKVIDLSFYETAICQIVKEALDALREKESS